MMNTLARTLALVLASSFAARAEEGGSKGSAVHAGSGGGGYAAVDTGLFIFDLFLNMVSLGIEVAAMDSAIAHAPPPPDALPQRVAREDEDAVPRSFRVLEQHHQAREGLLLSFGLGGGSLYASNQSPRRTGAFDLDFRLGYGFSDRFQFFLDLGLDAGSYRNGLYGSDDLSSWTLTFRGQTVLIGDRAGNGLNLNLGVGLGGITRNSGYPDQSSSPAGLAVAGGLSYDARVSPWFALSPELFYVWHTVPDLPGQRDVANVYGMRLNFLWYLR